MRAGIGIWTLVAAPTRSARSGEPIRTGRPRASCYGQESPRSPNRMRETMLDRETADAAQGQLLRRIAAQDRQALAEFYDQAAGPLFSLSLRILGDAHEAEEVI